MFNFSISTCTIPWFLWNWITCSQISNVQPKSTSHSKLFWKKPKIDAEYVFLVINVNTVLKKSKFVWVAVDKSNLDDRLQKMDVTDICNCERANAKGRIHQLTQSNVTLPYSKMLPWVANTLNYQDRSGENPCVNSLTFRRSCRKPYNDNFCLFGVLPVRLFAKEKLAQKISKTLNLLNKFRESDTPKLQSAQLNNLLKVEVCCSSKVFITTLILMTENSLQYLLVEISRKL